MKYFNKLCISGLFILFSLAANASGFDMTYNIYYKLVKAANLKNYPELIIEDSDEINAYYGDGSISVNTRLIHSATDAQLAFVLGHELGHFINNDTSSSYNSEYGADRYSAVLITKIGYNRCVGGYWLKKFGNRTSVESHPSGALRYRNIGC